MLAQVLVLVRLFDMFLDFVLVDHQLTCPPLLVECAHARDFHLNASTLAGMTDFEPFTFNMYHALRVKRVF